MEIRCSWKTTTALSRPTWNLTCYCETCQPLPCCFTIPPHFPEVNILSAVSLALVVTKDDPRHTEIDRVRAISDHVVICHHCHRTSHYASEGPQVYNIWTMTAEKLELLPELLALEDSPGELLIKSKPKVSGQG